MTSPRREEVLAAVTGDWETAREIADRAGVSLQSAAKILELLFWQDEVLRDHDAWVDDKFRKRERWLYRRQVRVDPRACRAYAAWGGWII